MPDTCILTDSSVQLLNEELQNYEHVIVVPHRLFIDSQWQVDAPSLLNNLVLTSDRDTSQILLQPPSVEDFRQLLGSLSDKYHHILVILVSSHLSQAYQNACQAVIQLRGAASIQVIDSQTIGAGLGFLVQAAAEAVQQGKPALQINRLVRGMIPHVYTIFCLQSMNYLAASGYLDPAQAAIGEFLGIIPFYVIDGGKLVPIQKARSMRQFVDVLHEFVTEFEQVDHIALLFGPSPYDQEMHNLEDRLAQDLPEVPVSKHPFSAGMAVLLGPRSFGVAVLEHISEVL